MKFYYAFAATAGMAIVLGIGMVKMSNGHPALLIASLAVGILAFVRFGCATH